jgi:hypothetical protein
MKKIALKIMFCFFQIIKYLLLISVIIVLFGLISPYIKNLKSYPYLYKINASEKIINQQIKSYIPTDIAGKDLSRVISIIFLFILANIASTIAQRIKNKEENITMQDEVTLLRKTYKDDIHVKKISELENTMKNIDSAPKKNRKELLNEFVAIKKELEKSGRELAFLSIDVVNSTGMKQNEESPIIEHDFSEYHQYIEAKIKKNGYIKASWTPDGIMICFNTVDDAVNAARDVISGLDDFNKNVKMMKQDFSVRCGINAGFVYFDDATPLEEISDRVIDIAGHMQKHALTNTISLPKNLIEPMVYKEGFQPSTKIIDGLEVFQWGETTTIDKT